MEVKMDTNDFLGSFAQENVTFQTQIVKTTSVGDNFWKVMIFVEPGRYVTASDAVWQAVAGSTKGAKALVVTADDYADYTSGLLKSWLYDLFCTGFTGECILVSTGSSVSSSRVYPVANPAKLRWYVSAGEGLYIPTTDDIIVEGITYYTDTSGTVVNPSTFPLYSDTSGTVSEDTTIQAGTTYYMAQEGYAAFNEAMDEVYGLLKPYAYHKTVCAGATDGSIEPQVAVSLAKLCTADKGLLSSAPYFPYTTDPTQPGWQVMSDALYAALMTADADAFMSCYADTTRNAALYSLGKAMSEINASGTCVGNSLDVWSSLLIASSGPNGTGLAKALRVVLNNANIQTWKAVGDNSGAVAAEGHKTIKGDVIGATWILSYITYMTKVDIAVYLTRRPNLVKNADTYSSILTLMFNEIEKFGNSGSKRLRDIRNTAPSIGELPEAKNNEIVITNAWEATYMPDVDHVKISGTLYIGE